MRKRGDNLYKNGREDSPNYTFVDGPDLAYIWSNPFQQYEKLSSDRNRNK